MALEYPALREENVVEEHFGLKIPDPYRWLEDPDSPETVSFVEAENKVTESYLARCTCTGKIRERLTAMWDHERYSCPFKVASHFYYWHNSGLQNQSILYRLETFESTPAVYLDPNAIDPDGLASIGGYNFSEEGKYFCYGVSHGGSDWAELRFKHGESGEDHADVLKRVKFSSIEWTHDEKGLFYCMFLNHEGKADGTETTSNTNQKLMYHRIGTEQAADILCAEQPDHPKWMIHAEVSVCGRYVLVTFTEGCEPKNQLFYCDLASIDYNITGKLNLIPIVNVFEATYEYVTNVGTKFVLRTNLNAPMYKLITIDLENIDRENWRDLIGHDDQVLLELAVCVNNDKLVVCKLKDVTSCLSTHHLENGNKISDIHLPLGCVSRITGRKRDSMAFIQFTSFLTPGQIYSYDFSSSTPQLKIFRESHIKSVDFSAFAINQVFYPSKDGTRIPMFIVAAKNHKRDGSTPCELYGYGGFDISITPSFSISRSLMLLHFGGMFAVANIRGGGEYGKRWHDAGRLEAKQNSFMDFQSAAEYLIAEKYTRSDKLFINGGSNGGLLVCACCNQRPDLFGAAVAKVPVCDMLRFHKFTIGHAWTSDYGNPEVENDFRQLLSYSPLHNIRAPTEVGVQYPALLIMTADHDDRVVPLHSFKFIATLQTRVGSNGFGQTKPLVIRIETNAGHGAGKPTSKLIDELTDQYAFLQVALGLTWRD